MHERSGLERLPRLFAAKARRGERTQLVVHSFEQTISCACIARFHILNHPSHGSATVDHPFMIPRPLVNPAPLRRFGGWSSALSALGHAALTAFVRSDQPCGEMIGNCHGDSAHPLAPPVLESPCRRSMSFDAPRLKHAQDHRRRISITLAPDHSRLRVDETHAQPGQRISVRNVARMVRRRSRA